MASGVLAILGSGENAPGMTKVHRVLLARNEPARAVNLDTAYGFQENVPQMSQKLEEYFDVSLHTPLTTLHFARVEGSSDVERALFKRQVREANYVFAGPGSPSWALAQWAPLDFAEDLRAVLDQDGTLCISSAAALTLGVKTAPIYEIYKVGVTPYWLDGLDLLGSYGLSCAVIPHFDNNEGGNYDTRCCYLGERRLHMLEELLDDDVATLGVDEHTAAIFDFGDDTVAVHGRANAYWRRGATTLELANGSTTPLAQLRNVPVTATPTPAQTDDPPRDEDPVELARRVRDGGADALEALATLVARAETGSSAHIDPTTLIDGVLNARREARAAGQYQLADQLRDALTNAGITVNDGEAATTWSLS